MKDKVKALWKLCFNDSEEFTEMYFKLRYKSEVNIAIESGDEVISALQMLPYPMTFCGETVQTSYISGACTHPEFRSKGVMRELLSQAFARMSRSEVLFSTLIPAESWLFDYYARMGYAPVFKYSTKEIVLPEFVPSKEIAVETVGEYKEEVYNYINKKLSERPCCIQHTVEDFQVIMADLAVSGGSLFIARQDGEMKGAAIIYNGEKKIIINDLFADTKDIEYSLLYAIRERSGCKYMVQLMPLEKNLPSHTLGMARIINAKEVLQMFAAAFPEEEMQFELRDKQLSVNNGYYYISKGKCKYSTERLPGAHMQMTISELTDKILRPLKPYMSLMLN